MDYEIKVPFAKRSCQECLNNGTGNYMALTLNDKIQYAAERHRDAAVVYECEKCGKRYMTKHPALCHVPRCLESTAGRRQDMRGVRKGVRDAIGPLATREARAL